MGSGQGVGKEVGAGGEEGEEGLIPDELTLQR
jgi:hypothetical protein